MNIRTMFMAGLCLVVVACSNPREQALPADAKQAAQDTKFQDALHKLTPEEQATVQAYLARRAISEVLPGMTGGPVAHARTISEAIADQQKFVADQKQKEAEAKALAAKVEADRLKAQAAMDDTLTVALTKKTFTPSDVMAGRLRAEIGMDVAFKNKTTKNIKGVKGHLLFEDVFGDHIRRLGLSVDEAIPAGKTFIWEGSVDYNQFNEKLRKLRDAPLEKLKVTWEPEVILFEDGTTIKVNAPEPSDEP